MHQASASAMSSNKEKNNNCKLKNIFQKKIVVLSIVSGVSIILLSMVTYHGLFTTFEIMGKYLVFANAGSSLCEKAIDRFKQRK